MGDSGGWGVGERREGISRHAENARKARKFKRNLILECNLSRPSPTPNPPPPPPPTHIAPTPPRGIANRSHYRNHCAFNKPLHYYLPHPPPPHFFLSPLFCLFVVLVFLSGLRFVTAVFRSAMGRKRLNML